MDTYSARDLALEADVNTRLLFLFVTVWMAMIALGAFIIAANGWVI